ncbi:MAG TPA: LptF/LptG family permease [Phycisphaerales bacterium]|nr:LptF/LptG family permease [Phycisphaerales bacterium]
MKSTLSRYVARLYLVNVATLLVLLSGFVVSIDVIVNLRRFSTAADRVMSESAAAPQGILGTLHHGLLTATLVIDLWWPRLLQLAGFLIGVVLVAAMGFTCAQLVRHRELVAIMAGGMSLHRIARPFIVVAALFIGLQIANQELVIPRVAHLLARQPNESGKAEANAFAIRLAPDTEGRLFRASAFDTRNEDGASVLKNVWIAERDSTGRVVRTIEADEAVWDGKGWVLTRGLATPETNGSAERPKAVPIARVDSSLDPTRLKVRYLQGFGQNLSWGQIAELLNDPGIEPREQERLERLRWGRIGALASNLITLVAALPFFLLREPRPMVLPSLKAAPIALAGLAASAMSAVVSVPGLPIAVGVFVPALVLLPVAMALYSGIRT